MYFEMMLIRDDGKHAWENQPSKYTVADINMNDLRTYLNNAKKAGRITFESDDPEVEVIMLMRLQRMILMKYAVGSVIQRHEQGI